MTGVSIDLTQKSDKNRKVAENSSGGYMSGRSQSLYWVLTLEAGSSAIVRNISGVFLLLWLAVIVSILLIPSQALCSKQLRTKRCISTVPIWVYRPLR
jgi:hypothetical protein